MECHHWWVENENLRHYSFISGTWLIYTWGGTQLHAMLPWLSRKWKPANCHCLQVWHDSVIYVAWRIHVCHVHIRHESCIWDMTRTHMTHSHSSFICAMCIWDMTRTHMTHSHGSFVFVCVTCILDMSCAYETWLAHTWRNNMAHSYCMCNVHMRHDSYIWDMTRTHITQ